MVFDVKLKCLAPCWQASQAGSVSDVLAKIFPKSRQI